MTSPDERIARVLAAAGLPRGAARLLALVLHRGPIQQGAAAVALGSSEGTVSRDVDWLEREGLVRRTLLPRETAGNRARLLSLGPGAADRIVKLVEPLEHAAGELRAALKEPSS